MVKMTCLLAFLALILHSCGLHYPGEPHDPSKGLVRKDFLDLTQEPSQNSAIRPLQKTLPFLLPPPAQEPLEKYPLLTLTVTPDVPLLEVFQVIAEKSGLGLVLDPALTGKIFYKAAQQPLLQILEAICSLTGLRYDIKNGVLRIEKDEPYLKVYDVRFLSMTRENQGTIATTTSMVGISNDASQKDTNGSSTYLSEKGSSDFWTELEANLSQILGQPWESPPKIGPIVLKEKPKIVKDNGGQKLLQKPAASPPTLPTQKTSLFSLNKQAGLISVRATQLQHAHVEDFLKRLRDSLSRQILIEAKVVEVTLNDEYRSGINWKSALGDFHLETPSSFSGHPETGLISIGAKGKNMTSILNIMESFGTVRTLSSPRLTVMNNQTAILKVADNLVFFQVKYDRQYYIDTRNDQPINNVIAKSTIQTVPVGFIMTVQPAIDSERDEIIMTLRPSITRVMGKRNDPAVQLMAGEAGKDIQSEVPIIAVREMDSVLRMSSGQVAILGGLMQESSKNVEAGLPGMSDTPFSFFTQSKSDDHAVVELVIFIKATILRDSPAGAADQKTYRTYFKDPRPFAL